MKMRILSSLFLICLFGVFLFWNKAEAAPTDCSYYKTSNPLGSDYAPPVNVFSPNQLLLRAFCDSPVTSVDVLVGKAGDPDIAVYKKGWYYTGTTWTEITFSGSALSDDPTSMWLTGQGEATIADTHQGYNFFVGYVCVRSGGSWKCGCRGTACTVNNWQLQAFNNDQQTANCSGGTGNVPYQTSRSEPYLLPPACVGKPYDVKLSCRGTDRLGYPIPGQGQPEWLKGGKGFGDPGTFNNHLFGIPTEAGTFEFSVRGVQGTATCGGKVKLIVSP